MAGEDDEVEVFRVIVGQHVYLAVGGKLRRVDEYQGTRFVNLPGKPVDGLKVAGHIGRTCNRHQGKFVFMTVELGVEIGLVQPAVGQCVHMDNIVVIPPGGHWNGVPSGWS